MRSFAFLLAVVAALLILTPVKATSSSSSLVLPAPEAKRPPGGEVECKICVEFMDEAVDELLNIIANGGVIGGCSKLCSYLSSEWEATICDLLCSAVGIDVFVHLVEDVDPDPIWICQEIAVCPKSENASASIVQFSVAPTSGPAGTEFVFDIEYNVTGYIGTGEILFWCYTLDGNEVGTASMLYEPALGVYGGQLRLSTKPNDNEAWYPGYYVNEFDVCAGGCGSKHQYAKLLASAYANFTITDNGKVLIQNK